MTKSVLSVALAGLVGCAVDDPQLGSTAGMTFEEFAAQTAREPGSGAYVVDADLVVRGEAELRAFYDRLQPGGLTIYRTGGADVRWNATERKQLTYCVSDAFGAHKPAVVAAMRTAADAGWETFSDVDFTYVPAEDASCTAKNERVLFDVSPISSAPYTARSFYPHDPRAYRNVLIDDAAFASRALTLDGLLGHELGHTLGFRHEHIRPEAANDAEDCVEDGRFRSVTPYDSASIMHYPQCHGTGVALAFSAADRAGAVLVYGAPGSGGEPASAAPVAETEDVGSAEIEDTGGGCTGGDGGAGLGFGVVAFALTLGGARRRYQRT